MNCPARMLSTQYLSQTERCSSESTAAALYPFAKNRSASATPPRTSCESSICGMIVGVLLSWPFVMATDICAEICDGRHILRRMLSENSA